MKMKVKASELEGRGFKKFNKHGGDYYAKQCAGEFEYDYTVWVFGNDIYLGNCQNLTDRVIELYLQNRNTVVEIPKVKSRTEIRSDYEDMLDDVMEPLFSPEDAVCLQRSIRSGQVQLFDYQEKCDALSAYNMENGKITDLPVYNEWKKKYYGWNTLYLEKSKMDRVIEEIAWLQGK